MPSGACNQSGFAAALLDPALPCPAGLQGSTDPGPSSRFAVYRNNVVSSLIDAVADTFPVVQQLVGVEFFRAMAGVFVRLSPPRSPVLAHYGDEFPDFVERFIPARSVPYLADVARLEFARVQAFHAADAEPLAAEVVQSVLASGDRIGELRLVCHPSLQAIASRHAVVSLWAAHQVACDIASVDVHAPECAIVTRCGLEVLVVPVPQGAVDFVLAIQSGQSLGDAAANAAAASEASFDLAAILTLLLGHQSLVSLDFPERLSS